MESTIECFGSASEVSAVREVDVKEQLNILRLDVYNLSLLSEVLRTLTDCSSSSDSRSTSDNDSSPSQVETANETTALNQNGEVSQGVDNEQILSAGSSQEVIIEAGSSQEVSSEPGGSSEATTPREAASDKGFNPPGYLKTVGPCRTVQFFQLSEEEQTLQKKTMAMLKQGFNKENFTKYMEVLLYLEAHQLAYDIRQHDMRMVFMPVISWDPLVLALLVPGLPDGRPSVFPGDRIGVRVDYKFYSDNIVHEGLVEEIWNTTVFLTFDSSFRRNLRPGARFHIQFDYSRRPLEISHNAIKEVPFRNLECFLFPDEEEHDCFPPLVPSHIPLQILNQQIASNPEQVKAVNHILRGSARPYPYILFGPPGTGKTVTVVEAIVQVFHNLPKSHILVCAPSNSAADLLTTRLLRSVHRHSLYRFNASSRDWKSIPKSVQLVSNYNSVTGRFTYLLESQELHFKRIIICTPMTAARLKEAGVPEGHFTHVFIDEAGQCSEPVTLIAVCGFLLSALRPEAPACGGNLILAGDPQQLGPYAQSHLARSYGLGKSLMERLINSRRYSRRPDGSFDDRVITKLVRSFRSHAEILTVSNKLFYENELQPSGDKIFLESLCQWEGLPEKGFPMLFHHVEGTNKKYPGSPSFFNKEEIKVVLSYVQQLQTSKFNILPEDIGIITPYRAQVKKLRSAIVNKLTPPALHGITVGSTEEFQGQERKVIILSTVRSDPERLTDNLSHLGFISNPKRFNVAITRARCLLIVVGNARPLSQEPNWARLIHHIYSQGGFRFDS